MDTVIDMQWHAPGAAGRGTARALGRPVRRRAAALAGLAVAASLLASAAPARADLAPDLSVLLGQATSGQPIGVIVTLAAQVDLAAYANDPIGLIAAKRALADQTQPAVADLAGVPTVSLWSINALGLSASAATIQLLAANPLVARIDLDPGARIAPVPGPSTWPQLAPAQTQTATITASAGSVPARQMTVTVLPVAVAPLRLLGAVQRGVGGARNVVISLVVDRPAFVRAELRTGRGTASARIVARAGARSRRAGRMAIVVRLPAGTTGPLRIRLTAHRPGGARIGAIVERPLRLAA